jgi:hypothetical protein
MQRWIWRRIGIDLPDDWEMLSFSRRSDQGRCTFADRYQTRAELSWRTVPGPPDFNRMVSDYLASLRALPGADPDTLTPRHVSGGWHGIRGPWSGQHHTRLSRFLPDLSCLVELVTFWPDMDEELLASILRSVRNEPDLANGTQRWRAFGMEMLATPDLDMLPATIAPASHAFHFGLEGRDRHHRYFERYGMLRYWLDTDPAAWLATRRLAGSRVDRTWTREQQGHVIHFAHARRRRREIRVLGSRWMDVSAAAWLCPECNRLHCAVDEIRLRDARPELNVAALLGCCGGRTLAP